MKFIANEGQLLSHILININLFIVHKKQVGHLLGCVHDGSPPPSYLGGPGKFSSLALPNESNAEFRY